MLRSTAAATLLTVVALAGVAHASPLKQKVDAARSQYVAMEYETVIKLVTPIVSSPDASAKEKVDALELLGLAHLILGDKARARAAFEQLLALEPDHELRDPSGSPKLRKFFDSVKQAQQRSRPPAPEVRLEHEAPQGAVAGRAVEFAVRVASGARQVSTVKLMWRKGDSTSFHETPMTGAGRMAARLILPLASETYQLAYYLEARGSDGKVVQRVGSAEQPLQLAVAGEGRPRPPGTGTTATPFYKTWWFWTAVGAAVAGAATATTLVLMRDEAPTGNLSPGKVTLN